MLRRYPTSKMLLRASHAVHTISFIKINPIALKTNILLFEIMQLNLKQQIKIPRPLTKVTSSRYSDDRRTNNLNPVYKSHALFRSPCSLSSEMTCILLPPQLYLSFLMSFFSGSLQMLIKHTSVYYHWSCIFRWGNFRCITEKNDRLRKSSRVFERAVLIVDTVTKCKCNVTIFVKLRQHHESFKKTKNYIFHESPFSFS